MTDGNEVLATRPQIMTVPELLVDGATRWPDEPWCTAPDGRSTRAAMYEDALRCASSLQRRGVSVGDRIVLVLPNSLDFVRAWFAAAMVGAIAVPMNPRAAKSELSLVLGRTKPAVVVLPEGAQAPHGVVAVAVADLLDGPNDYVPPAVTTESHVAYIQSSGSTGEPKFIIQTHGMYTMAAEGFPYWLNLSADDVLLTSLPLAHLNAQVYSTLGSWVCGAQLVLLPKFSVSTFWETVHRTGATVVNMIGAMLEMLLAQPASQAEKDHRLRLCYSAPAPDEERHREIESRFGFRLIIGYAQSESPYGLINATDEPTTYGSMGRPRQHPRLGRVNEACVVDPASGRTVPDGHVGELLLRNPAMTPGYAGDPEQTAALFDNGWLHTGDLVRRDLTGQFTFAGRIKEMIRRRGENLSPAEIEQVTDRHPAVASSAAIGVPSELTEEDIKIYVKTIDGAELTAEQIGDWCRRHLPPYKVPRYVEFVRRWPLTDTNKIAKKQLSTERSEREFDLAAQPGHQGAAEARRAESNPT